MTIAFAVFGDDVRLRERTHRAATAWGLVGSDDGWCWALRAGTWPLRVPGPTASATGRPLALLGLADPPTPAWSAWCARSGGDGDRVVPPADPFSVLLDPVAAARWRAAVAAGVAPEAALTALLADPGVRRVRWAGADVGWSAGLRVAQVVTSLQRGGAERVALDLHAGLPAHGIGSLLVAAGPPARATWPAPADVIDLAGQGDRARRMTLAAERVARDGADLVHAHLLTADDLAPFAALGLPRLATVHNARAAWPPGLASLRDTLLVACCRAVEDELAVAAPAAARRTVWNGIAPERATVAPAAVATLRAALALPPDAVVLTALANPRPQKRLELLPAVATALAHRLRRPVHLLVAGEAGTGPGAAEAEAALAAAVAAHAPTAVHRLGAVTDVAPLLALSDLLVAPSRWEGLSLAWLEALAAGVPVLTAAVGGATEVAAQAPLMTCLPVDADVDAWVAAAARVLAMAPGRVSALPAAFTVDAMVAGYARLYPRWRAAHASRRPARGVWLATNNLSTGGAQSSARRLLLALAGQGERVRCALLQEDPARPTAGRVALAAAGVAVHALPPPGDAHPDRAVAELCARIEADPPAAVLLWNAMPSHKVRLAEALFGVPLWDVSPGEMNFASLERFFARLPPSLALRDARDYGARLAGAVVKYAAEAPRARSALGRDAAVIANGVDLPARPARPARAAPLVLGTAARLAPHKRLEDLFAALRLAEARLPSWELRIAGGVDGDDIAYAEAVRAAAAGLPVRFLGDVAEIGAFLADLDLFVLVAEPAGCPNASLEAMAHGLAVVATDVGGMAEQVVDGVTGRLVPPRDDAALADAIVALAADPERRAACGAAGRARVRARFATARMAIDYRRLWAAAVAAR